MVIASLIADVPIDDPITSGSDSTSSSWPIVIGAVAVVAVLLVGVGVFLRRRANDTSDE